MASITDSIRAVYSDNYALIKLAIFSYIFFFIFELTTPGAGQKVSTGTSLSYIQIGTLAFFYSGFCSIIINNRIKQDIVTLPKSDPMKILTICAKCSVVVLPYLILGFPVIHYLVGLFHFEGVPQMVAIAIIQLILVAIIVTSIIYFSRDFKVKDSFDLRKIISGFPDVLVYTLLGIIGLAIINLFIGVPILYFAYSFFDIGPVFRYAAFFILTTNIACLSDYCGQLNFDLETREL